MSHDPVGEALISLTEDELTYQELQSLYYDLLDTSEKSAEVNVERYALAYIIKDIISYLDYVSEELEKSFGLPRSVERERIFKNITGPNTSVPVERVNDIIRQWESIDTYSTNDIINKKEETV